MTDNNLSSNNSKTDESNSNQVLANVNSIPPRIARSQSANDASAVHGSYFYDDGSHYSRPDPQNYYNAICGYDAYGYHQYHAQRAPNDEAAAYHQYHAQQAVLAQAQQPNSAQLAPIYDHSALTAGYYPQQSKSGQPVSDSYTSFSSNRNSTASPSAYVSSSSSASASKTKRKVSGSKPSESCRDSSNFLKKKARTQLILKHKKAKNKQMASSSNSMHNGTMLPANPSDLQHAATVGHLIDGHGPTTTNANDLHFELEQIQSEKERKRLELESKRSKLSEKHSQNMLVQSVLEETRQKWNAEREAIIKSFGGKMPSFIIEADKLRKDLQNMSNRNSALEASLEVISSHLQNELYQLQCQLKMEKEIATQTHEHNMELERRVRELRIEKLELETEIKSEKQKQNELQQKQLSPNSSTAKQQQRAKSVSSECATTVSSLMTAPSSNSSSSVDLKSPLTSMATAATTTTMTTTSTARTSKSEPVPNRKNSQSPVVITKRDAKSESKLAVAKKE